MGQSLGVARDMKILTPISAMRIVSVTRRAVLSVRFYAEGRSEPTA